MSVATRADAGARLAMAAGELAQWAETRLRVDAGGEPDPGVRVDDDEGQRIIGEVRGALGVLFQAGWSADRIITERGAHLSPRQIEILALLARGLVVKQVAGELGLTPKTVENHKTALFAARGGGGDRPMTDQGRPT